MLRLGIEMRLQAALYQKMATEHQAMPAASTWPGMLIAVVAAAVITAALEPI
jgi:hypothetical protein